MNVRTRISPIKLTNNLVRSFATVPLNEHRQNERVHVLVQRVFIKRLIDNSAPIGSVVTPFRLTVCNAIVINYYIFTHESAAFEKWLFGRFARQYIYTYL